MATLPLRRSAARTWADWTAHTRRMARFQSAMLLSLAYVIVAGPICLIARIAGKRLLTYRDGSASTWLPRRVDPRSLADLDRPY